MKEKGDNYLSLISLSVPFLCVHKSRFHIWKKKDNYLSESGLFHVTGRLLLLYIALQME